MIPRPVNANLKWPILGVLAAIAITTTMDATGLSAFSALPLLPLLILFWFLQRFSRTDVGFTLGNWRHYGLAVFYPVIVIGAVAGIAAATGAVDLSKTNWDKAWLNCARVALATFLVVILTEEGFFRGWLFASLRRANVSPTRTWVWSSGAFALWHLSAVALDTGFNPPVAQIPVFMVNAAVMGLVWGLLRWISGSVIVASLSHGVWNGFAYIFFGFGKKVGALGIVNSAIYGPEVGVLGLVINAAFAFALWRWWRARSDGGEAPVESGRGN
jgi:membrane protease YdiL (CAAX protease family)